MAFLSITNRDGSFDIHPVDVPTFTIGRGSENDLPIQHPLVSRRHAVITLATSGCLIQDLGSKNGTWLNDLRLSSEPTALNHGDVLNLGGKQLSLQFFTDEETFTADAKDWLLHGLAVDLQLREASVNGSPVTLSRKEFNILGMLWERRGVVCHRHELADAGWPEREGGDVAEEEIEQYISRLRRRLGDTGREHHIIQTVRGYGYKIPR